MAVGDFDVTTFSGLSVGVDPARTDLTPQDRGTGAVLSIGTIGAGIKKILSDSQTLAVGGVTASRTTVVTSTITGCATGDSVIATPPSTWSGTYDALSYQGYVSGANTVTVALSNNSGNNITVADMAWRITVIDF